VIRLDLDKLETELKAYKRVVNDYERKIIVYKRVIVSLVIGIFCAVFIAVLHVNSYRFVLRFNGISQGMVLSEFESNLRRDGWVRNWFGVNNHFRTVFCKNDGGRILFLRRNRLGFWFRSERVHLSETDGLIHGWVDVQGISYFDLVRDIEFNHTYNLFYYNTNATSKIRISAQSLPPGVALNSWQNGRNYWLHFVWYQEDAFGEMVIGDLISNLLYNFVEVDE